MRTIVDLTPAINVTNAEEKRSERPQVTPSEAVATRLMHSVQSWFHSQELPKATIALYLKAWAELVDKHGEERFKKAVWGVINEANFFPLPADIKRRCEELASKVVKPAHEIVDYMADVQAHPENYFAFGKDPRFLELITRCKEFKRGRAEGAKHSVQVRGARVIAAAPTAQTTAFDKT